MSVFVISPIKALLLDEFPSEAQAIEASIGAIKKARSDRNEVLHWLWGKSEDSETVPLATIRPFRKTREKSKTAAEIQAVAEALFSATMDLHRWSDKAFEALRASWPQRFEQPSGLLGLAFPLIEDPLGTPGLPGPQQEPSQE